MSLKIENEEHYNKVVNQARQMGKFEQLGEKLDWLRTYACPDDDVHKTRCLLYYDFAPLSFGFTMQMRQPDGTYKTWFNGGLIYHGQHDNGGDGGAPTFSVNLNPTDGWSIHT